MGGENKTTVPLTLIEFLFDGYIPVGTKIVIERSKLNGKTQYIYRLRYTSKNSGRTMCVVAKGPGIPFSRNDLFNFYLRQVVLTPAEASKEFSRLYFLERRARQDEFLFGSINVRVSDAKNVVDRQMASQYSPAAQYDQIHNKVKG